MWELQVAIGRLLPLGIATFEGIQNLAITMVGTTLGIQWAVTLPDGALLLPPFLSVTLYIVQKPVQSWMPLEIENYSLPKWKREPLLWHRECCLFSDFRVAPHCVPPASVSAPAKCPCPLFDWNAHSFDTCFGCLHLDRAFLTHSLSLLWSCFGCPALLLFYPWHFFTH